MYARTANAHRTHLILGALVATMSAVRPQFAGAQRVAGSIDVALTVLPPVVPRTVEVSRFRVERNGMATFRADFPPTSRASQLFVTRVSSSVDGPTQARVIPDVVRRSSATDIGAGQVAYRIEVARPADGDSPHDVRLRLECLVLAGT